MIVPLSALPSLAWRCQSHRQSMTTWTLPVDNFISGRKKGKGKRQVVVESFCLTKTKLSGFLLICSWSELNIWGMGQWVFSMGSFAFQNRISGSAIKEKEESSYWVGGSTRQHVPCPFISFFSPSTAQEEEETAHYQGFWIPTVWLQNQFLYEYHCSQEAGLTFPGLHHLICKMDMIVPDSHKVLKIVA